jgi:hypothetical protein
MRTLSDAAARREENRNPSARAQMTYRAFRLFLVFLAGRLAVTLVKDK